MPEVVILGTRLHYTCSGSGTPLLLAHHAMGSIRSWRKQIPFFSEYFRVIAYDRRGHGASGGVETFAEDYLDRALDEMVDFLDALGVESAHVVGHSDGGTLGLMLAADHPERVRSLVTVGAHVFFEPVVAPGLMSLAQQVEVDADFRARAARHLGPDRALTHARRFAARWQSSFPTLDGLCDRIRGIRCPSLHLYGSADRFGTVAQADTMAALTGGKAHIIPGADHEPQKDMPDEFNRLVLAFLSLQVRSQDSW